MATRTAALHVAGAPATRRALGRRAQKLALELLLAAAMLTGGTVAVLLLSLLVLVTAPLAAVLIAWAMWRAGDGATREARRVRARLRRRARSLGLVVLAGSQPTLLRLVAAGRQRVTPRPAGR